MGELHTGVSSVRYFVVLSVTLIWLFRLILSYRLAGLLLFLVGLLFRIRLQLFLTGLLLFLVRLLLFLTGLLLFLTGLLLFLEGLQLFLTWLLLFLVGLQLFLTGLLLLCLLRGHFQVVLPSVFQCLPRFCFCVPLVCHGGVLLPGGRPGCWEPDCCRVVTRIPLVSVADVELSLSKRPPSRSRTAESFCSS